jgi:hypothetical protein
MEDLMMTLREGSNGKLILAMLAVISLTASALSRLSAQDTTVSATMLRVLAEAADVYRTGQPVFLVADYRFPHNVLRAFNSKADAERAKADSATYGVFGPYVTAQDPIPDNAPRIVGIRVSKRDNLGRVTTQNIIPAGADALFLSMSAIDKFVLPYYSKIYGPDFAQKLRDKIHAGQLYRHCFSNMCEDPGGQLKIVEPRAH